MAVVTIHDFPTTIIPDSTEWGLVTNTQIFTSPLSGDTQTVALPGARWAATLNFSNMTPSVARSFIAFLLKLKGPAGRFRLFDHSNPTTRGSGSTTGTYPAVSGANQVGNAILTSGWTPTSLNLLLPGDYFQIGEELKMITAAAQSNSGGLSTLEFDPPIRNAPADGSNIIIQKPTITQKPTCVMRLIDDSQILWTNAETIILSGITIQCEEVFFNG